VLFLFCHVYLCTLFWLTTTTTAKQGEKVSKKTTEGGDDLEARRAALRDKLAAKFKQDLISDQ
jgi:hypothetical protein